VGEVAEVLSHAIQRRVLVDEQNRDAARQVASELTAVIGEAQEATSQAERGFVEATSLQTSVREIQRLSTELASALTRVGTRTAGGDPTRRPSAHGRTLKNWSRPRPTASNRSGAGLLRVQDISEQVQRIANRATLIGIQALSGTGDPTTFADELKQLAHDVREATDRTAGFAQDIDRAVSDSDARMREARERAIARMEAPVPARPAAITPAPDVQRLVERVLEMVRDASTKGERVSNASERASSIAERLMRRLEGNASDADALVERLVPVGEAIPPATPAITHELRLVDPADADDRPDEPGASPREEERP
jgi:hypothetical protein